MEKVERAPDLRDPESLPCLIRGCMKKKKQQTAPRVPPESRLQHGRSSGVMFSLSDALGSSEVKSRSWL